MEKSNSTFIKNLFKDFWITYGFKGTGVKSSHKFVSVASQFRVKNNFFFNYKKI